MPKFNIPVTRDCTETTMVDVEAATVEDAIHEALVEANDEPWKFDWTHDDNSGDQNVAEFVGDPDEIEPEEEEGSATPA